MWMDSVSSTDIVKRRGRPFTSSKKSELQALHDFYAWASSNEAGFLPTTKTSATNLSHVKNASISQLVVNYKNNVHCHFDKYVQRLVTFELRNLAIAATPGDAPLSKAAKKQLNADIRQVTADILEGRHDDPSCRPELRPWVTSNAALLTPSRIASSRGNNDWRFYNQKSHPQRWLPHMVYISRRLEAQGSSDWLSPLPLTTSSIPGHIRIDTTSLIDLLIASKDDVCVLKTTLEATPMTMEFGDAATSSSTAARNWCLPKLTGKGQLFDDLSTLVPETVATEVAGKPLTSSFFKTALWQQLTKLGTNKHAGLTHTTSNRKEHTTMVFNNVIDTDGFSVSLHYVDRSLFGQTRFNGGFKLLKASQKVQGAAEKNRGGRYLTSLTNAERAELLNGTGSKLGADPGKQVLLCISNGTRTLRYTRAQQQFESGQRLINARRKDMVRKRPVDGRSISELQASIGLVTDENGVQITRRSSRTSTTANFEHYLRTRLQVAPQLNAFYKRTIFRRDRYRGHVGRQAATDRFISTIRNTFGPVDALMYGNWGARPNIKHQPPSPGVGLRRRIAQHFRTFLVDERYTSSVCPCCGNRGLEHPRQRDVFNHKTGNLEQRAIHHLLKCANGDCQSPWWHRDVLAALNIHRKGLHCLQTGKWSPVYC